MKFTTLLTATLVSTGIVLGAVATPAFAQNRGNSGNANSGGGNSGNANSGGGNSGNANSGGGDSGSANSGGGNSGGGSTTSASACPTVAGTALCLGAFDGNDTGAQGTAISNLNSLIGPTWTLAGKSDDGFGSFSSGGHGGESGVWSTGLSGAGAFAVKASTGYLLFQTNDISTINWSTLGLVNNGGNTPGLSHLSVFTGGPGGGGPQQEVPEPLTLLGSGLALGFGGMFQKKRNAKKSAK